MVASVTPPPVRLGQDQWKTVPAGHRMGRLGIL